MKNDKEARKSRYRPSKGPLARSWRGGRRARAEPRHARGRAACSDRGSGDGGVHLPWLCRDAARRHRQARRCREGHDLPALQGQGIDVRGAGAHRDRAGGGAAQRIAAADGLGTRSDRSFCEQLPERGDRHKARRSRAPDRGRGAALSVRRRFLLPRGRPARDRRHERADRARHCPRRDPREGPRALSADPGRAGDDRGDLAEPVCAARAARCAGHAARPSRFDFWRTEDDMRSSQAFFSFALAAVLAAGLAGCNEKRDPGFQGWVEADMIFVSPDEAGRVTKLDIREGDAVKVGDPLYDVDDDLQLADLNQTKATLANAQQVFDRADSLRKTGSGTQAALDSAVSDLRVAQARVVTSQTRLARRKGFAPVAGTIQQIYFREGEMVAAQRPVLSIMPPGNMKLRFFVPEAELPKLAIGDEVRIACDNCAADLTAKIYFIATNAEYTPPVIYSLDERNKLVYLIQARPSRPDTLRVGQPISVYLNPKTPVADKR